MTPDDAARLADLTAWYHYAQGSAGVMFVCGVLIVVFALRIRVDYCSRCSHCRDEEERRKREQERLQREYADKHGLGDRQDPPRSSR